VQIQMIFARLAGQLAPYKYADKRTSLICDRESNTLHFVAWHVRSWVSLRQIF
jgi:hypothetical protein